jgi:phosphopantetheine adenylyltransferase
LGFEEELSLPIEFPSRQVATGLLVDRLVANSDYLKKLEQIENRKDNLKSLLG